VEGWIDSALFVHIAWSLACLATNMPLSWCPSLSVDALRALIELNVDMTRFEVQKGHQKKKKKKTPEATNHWRETWSLLLEDIKNENKVFDFFWSKSAQARRLWKKKEKELEKDMRKKEKELEKEWEEELNRICKLNEEEAKNEVLAAENDATHKVHKDRVMSWLDDDSDESEDDPDESKWKGLTSCEQLEYLHYARREEEPDEEFGRVLFIGTQFSILYTSMSENIRS
jgi:hypothetical protein